MLRKLLITVACIGVTTLAYASKDVIYAPIPMQTFVPSVYLGLQAGYGATNWNNLNNNVGDTEYKVSGSNTVGGRLYLGYSFSQHFDVEMGYTQFFNDTRIKNFSYNPKYSWAIDVAMKIKLHVADGFGVYTKIGFDYFNTSLGNVSNASTEAYNVVFGVGGTYNITDNLLVDLSWTRYNGMAEWRGNYVPFADLYALGLQYKFDLM